MSDLKIIEDSDWIFEFGYTNGIELPDYCLECCHCNLAKSLERPAAYCKQYESTVCGESKHFEKCRRIN